MRRSLSRLPCRRHNGRNRAVVSNWHCRLTYAAWAAPATALCALVTRDQQCNLANAASGFAPNTVLNAVDRRVFQGKPRGPAPIDTWRLRTSPRRGVGSFLLRGPDSIWGPGPGGGPVLPGRSGAPSCLCWLPPLGHVASPDPPQAGRGSGAVCRESMAPDHRGPAARLLGRS